MEDGEYKWDSEIELRTRCEITLKLHDGRSFFTAGKTPIAVAVLGPCGKKLDITIRVDRLKSLLSDSEQGTITNQLKGIQSEN